MFCKSYSIKRQAQVQGDRALLNLLNLEVLAIAERAQLKLDRLVIMRAMHDLQMLTSPSTWPYTPK